ncbi:beta-N-acetylhexosaminidase [Puteibacter caeruleilacunae]|nr:beta-N-acetylhexosaminidase [Puteibacter caeruleilacunae]
MTIRLITVISLVVLLASCTTRTFKKEEISLIPEPVKFTLNEESFQIDSKTAIYVQNTEQQKAASFLTTLLSTAAGFELEIILDGTDNSNAVVFKENKTLAKEAYKLSVNKKVITVEAASTAGYFYAVQTIRQLLPNAIEASKTVDAEWLVPCVEIEDQPRFSWRGMHVDFSRHFFTIDEVKQFLDYMALYKLNTFHMHLTDDQGWRIEIKKYPLLTEKGAWRTHNNQDTICLKRAKDDNTFALPKKNYKQIDGKEQYGGFFTQDQIREIVKYAGDRNITVVPEIDIPGHFKAAIDNYPFLSCTGEPGWGQTFSHPACLGKKTTYEFIQNILAEVAELFPCEYIHIGGDEVNKKSWEECRHCQREIRKNKLANEHELQSHFNREIEKFLHSKGKKLLGWDEIVEGGLSKDATMMWWRNWAPKARYIAADNGCDMVITPDFEYYFDFTYEATPVSKVYNYEPIPEDFTAEQSKHVLGVQANLWSEWIPNFRRLQHQALPRMLAVAETGWTPKDQKNFENFESRLDIQYDRFDQMGIYYHLESLEGLNKKIVFTDSAKAEIIIPRKDYAVHYTLDGSTPTTASPKYEAPFYIKEKCQLKARSFKGNIHSEVYSAEYDKQSYRNPDKAENLKNGIQRIAIKKRFGKVEEIEIPSNAKSKEVEKIGLGEYDNTDFFALVFEGYFKAEEDGIYEFYTKSDDGDLFYIGDRLVVDNGGSHADRKRSGMIALKKGYHKFTHKYRQLGGGLSLEAGVKTPAGKEIPFTKQISYIAQ